MSGSVLRCEISGETISDRSTGSSNDVMVVTPSGHICKKRYILSKLLENGGYDPFDIISMGNGKTSQRPLLENELIELKVAGSSSSTSSMSDNNNLNIVPPRINNTIHTTLQQLQNEYDAIILELFDTRNALQQTRMELSQALYQNDAAIRVVARIASERDEARTALVQYTGNSTIGTISSNNGQSKENSRTASMTNHENEPTPKKARVDETLVDNPTTSKANSLKTFVIPEDDLTIMLKKWDELHSTRKVRQKMASKQIVSSEILSTQYKPSIIYKDSWIVEKEKDNKNNNALTANVPQHLLSATTNHEFYVSTTNTKMGCIEKDSTVIDMESILTVENTTITCMDSMYHVEQNSTYTAIGSNTGEVMIYQNHNKALIGTLKMDTSTNDHDNINTRIVHVQFHPDFVHIIATVANGTIMIGRFGTGTSSNGVEMISCFQRTTEDEKDTYTTGKLHPDGLIYIAGTLSGDLQIWDFKSQTCAQILKVPTTSTAASTTCISPIHVTAVTISNNGYHVGAAYSNGKVVIWNLLNFSIITTYNDPTSSSNTTDAVVSSSLLQSVNCIQFDNSGKYLAYSGCCCYSQNQDDDVVMIRIVGMKENKEIAVLRTGAHPSDSNQSKNSVQTTITTTTNTTGLAWGLDNRISLVWDNILRSTGDNNSTCEKQRHVVIFNKTE